MLKGAMKSVSSQGTYATGTVATQSGATTRCVGIADTSLSLSLSLAVVR
jgi:hypothetical protein